MTDNNFINLRNHELEVTVALLGAEIKSVKSIQDNTSGSIEYMWRGDNNIWGRTAPILFPIVGKLKNDTYIYNDAAYTMTQHGFARDKVFKVLTSNDTLVELELKSDDTTLQVYPFNFRLIICYELKENKQLLQKVTVMNPSPNDNTEKPMLFYSLGYHPGFSVEAFGGMNNTIVEWNTTTTTDGKLQLERKYLESNGLLGTTTEPVPLASNDSNKKQLELKPELFDGDAIVLEDITFHSLSLISKINSRQIILSWSDPELYPYFGIWSKKGCTEFVCLEPWAGIADSVSTDGILINKKGILSLEPNTEKSFQLTYTFL